MRDVEIADDLGESFVGRLGFFAGNIEYLASEDRSPAGRDEIDVEAVRRLLDLVCIDRVVEPQLPPSLLPVTLDGFENIAVDGGFLKIKFLGICRDQCFDRCA